MTLPAFSESSRTRLLVGTLLYLAQGFPQAAVFYSIVTWLAVQGRSAADIAFVASAATLTWSLKALAGPVIDRYTCASMGRRRPWLIASQTVIFSTLLAFAALQPRTEQIALVTALSVIIAAAAAIQDTALDALVIDLTPDGEKGRLNGFMMAGKLLGMALGMAAGGFLIERFGISAAMLAMAALFAVPALVAIVVRERPGDKIIAWPSSIAAAECKSIAQVGWRGLAELLWQSLARQEALVVMAIIAIFGVATGIYQQGMVLFGVRQLGWGEARMGSLGAVSYIALAVPSLAFGTIIDRVGSRRIGLIAATTASLSFAALPALPNLWDSDSFFIAWVLLSGTGAMSFSLVGLVLAMRASSAAVAATSFAVLMAADSLGSAVGMSLLPTLDRLGGIVTILWTASAFALLAGLITLSPALGSALTNARENASNQEWGSH